MTLCRRSLILVGLVLFTLISLPAAQGQQPSPSTGASPSKPVSLDADEDVVVVNERREQLARQYSRIDRELSELLGQRSSISVDTSRAKEYVEQSKKDVETFGRKLEAAKKSGTDTVLISQLERDLEFAEGRRDSTERDFNRVTELEAKIKFKRDELDQLSAELATVDRRLAQLVNFEKERNSFRKLISGVFCALVGVVIIGFFFLARKKEIAEDIFSGEKGIQFITLFFDSYSHNFIWYFGDSGGQRAFRITWGYFGLHTGACI
jgi:hypothetical protein